MHESYEDRMLEAFIAKPKVLEWYKNSFSKFSTNEDKKLVWKWSWWAFFSGFLFLLYRKEYLASFVLFLISMALGIIPYIGNLAWMILSGGYSTYFIYKGYKRKRSTIESTIKDEDERVQAMQKKGGYHTWVIWVYSLFLLLMFLSILAALISAQ